MHLGSSSLSDCRSLLLRLNESLPLGNGSPENIICTCQEEQQSNAHILWKKWAKSHAVVKNVITVPEGRPFLQCILTCLHMKPVEKEWRSLVEYRKSCCLSKEEEYNLPEEQEEYDMTMGGKEVIELPPLDLLLAAEEMNQVVQEVELLSMPYGYHAEKVWLQIQPRR